MAAKKKVTRKKATKKKATKKKAAPKKVTRQKKVRPQTKDKNTITQDAEPFALYNTGFAERVPKAEEVQSGEHRNATLTRTAKALVLWVEAFGTEIGDEVTFRIYRPDGSELVTRNGRFTKRYARWFGYTGKRVPGKAWPVGVYRGEVHFRRDIDGVIREGLVTAEVEIIR